MMRVEMVRSFGLIDQARAPHHEEIALLARELAGSHWAVVSLVDAERIWFAGASNFSGRDADRWSSFCTHVISAPEHVLWIEDTTADFRVAHAEMVTGGPRVRFYAGAPVMVNGYAVGTVCVFDPDPRPFDPVLARSLTRLATMVGEDLASRHREQSLRSVLLASADALIDCDNQGVITCWSESAEQLFGFAASEAIGSKIDIIVPPDRKAAHSAGFTKWSSGGGARLGRRIDLEACRKDGTLVDIELWMSVAHERGVPHVHANIRDISERKAHAAALQRATEAAEAANEAKTAFLANMSHELRTPLNGVIGVVDLLAQTEQSDRQQELTAIIKASSDQLGRLIGDILDLARIESGAVVLEQRPMSIQEVLQSVSALSALSAEAKGIELRLHLASDLGGAVLGDPLRLKQVLTNMVSNAVKFTDSGFVSLEVGREDDAYTFTVRDTGIGFSPEQREVIFGRFQQADGTITRRFGGTGLGLAISSDLVAAMGGSLDCESTPGRGARFWFTITLGPVNTALTRPTSRTAPPSMGRVLVVDDNATNRRVAELILQSAGIEVAFAENGDEAVDAFLTERFDAILMDMMMPVLDGAEATRIIRDLERTHRADPTPIIMLTANSLPQHIEASLAAGADRHLAKPVTAAALFEALSAVLPQQTMEAGQSLDAA